MSILFDGTNRLITVSSDASITEIYSAWKLWVFIDDNAKYPPAFSQNGGEDIGDGITTGINTFIRNDYGWHMKPLGNKGLMVISGNLFPKDSSQSWQLKADITDDASFYFLASQNTQVVRTGGTGTIDTDDIVSRVITGLSGQISCNGSVVESIADIPVYISNNNLSATIKQDGIRVAITDDELTASLPNPLSANLTDNKTIKVSL